jgi:hypothetical protein
MFRNHGSAKPDFGLSWTLGSFPALFHTIFHTHLALRPLGAKRPIIFTQENQKAISPKQLSTHRQLGLLRPTYGLNPSRRQKDAPRRNSYVAARRLVGRDFRAKQASALGLNWVERLLADDERSLSPIMHLQLASSRWDLFNTCF